jgi:transcriptional regulator NrdR family protein
LGGVIVRRRECQACQRRITTWERINAAIEQARDEAVALAKSATIPKALRRQLTKRLTSRSPAWDEVLYEMAQERLLSEETDS